jgi:hypothetical protein
MLNALGESAGKAVLVCRTSGQPASTEVLRIDEEALKGWLEEYDGLGSVLDAGLENFIVAEPQESSE